MLTTLVALSESNRAQPKVLRDIEYARVDGTVLGLDLYLPDNDSAQPAPLVVYVHGGAWRAGSKSDMPLGALVQRGYAVASVDYRLSTEAPFPAQIHDIKAAIRFLRAEATQLGLSASVVAVSGSSAGGHLAALVGVSGGVKALEGNVGKHPEQSSTVQAIISLFGASNLQSILSQSTAHGLSVRVPALELLLGGQPAERPESARLASPVAHVDASDPPLLLIHGTADPQMPFEQSKELEAAYRAIGRPVELHPIEGGKHGGPQFYDAERIELMQRFLSKSLEGR